MKLIFKISLLGTFLCFSTFLNAQIISALGDAKNKGYESKVNKSPAKEEIIKTDKALDEVERFEDYAASGIYKSTTNYNSFVKNCEIVIELIPVIKEKDPKWKIEKQEDRFAPYKGKYSEVQELQKEYEALESSFQSYDQFFKDKQQQYSNIWSACGYSSTGRMDLTLERRNITTKKFRNFVLGSNEDDLQWEKLQSKIQEFQEIIENYKIAYKAKGGMERDIYSNALKTFTKGGYESPASSKEVFLSFIGKNIAFYENKTSSFNDLPENLLTSKCDLSVAEALLFLFPEDDNLQKNKVTIQSYHDGLLKKFRDEIAVSDFHANIIEGKYFSNKPVSINEASEADFKSKFKSTEPIYASFYYSSKFNNCSTQFEVIDKTNGAKISLYYHPEGIRENCENMIPYTQVTLVPNSFEEGKAYYYSIIELLMYLKDLKNDQVVLEIGGQELTIDLSEGTQKYASLCNQFLTYRSKTLNPPKPKTSFSLPMQKACREEGFNETIVKVIPTDEWIYEKNALGVVLSREIDAVILFKASNGKCFLRDVLIYQSKTDSGFASPVISRVSSSYHEELNNEQGKSHVAEDDDYRVFCKCL